MQQAASSTTKFASTLKSVAANIGISLAVNLVIQGISALIQYQEKLRQKTEEAANAYKETSSSIEGYTTRYKELHQALLDAKGNEEETYNVKKQLFDLQTELNDKYGDEYGRINLVTDAYKDQTEALKAYNKEAAQTFLNEKDDGIDDAKRAMTKKRQYNLGSFYNTDSDEAWNEAKKVAEKYLSKGIEIVSDDYDGSLSIRLTADAQSAEDTINEFMNDLRAKANELENEHVFDGILSMSSGALNDAKSVIDKYGEIYRQSLLADIASSDDGKAEKFNELISAVDEYNEAVLKSEDPYNDEEVAKARENLRLLQNELSGEDWEKYSSVIQEVLEEADTKLLDFYNRMKNGPEAGNVFDRVFGKLGVDELAEKAEKLRGLTRVDLESMAEDGDNGDVFDEYRESAESYGLSVEELIDMLIRLGIVQDDINNSISTIETPKTLKETLESAKDSIDDYQSSIKSLSDSMKDVSALSTSDIVDLMQEHPDFDWEKYGVTGAASVGELDDALKALIEQQMKEIDSALESAGASDEMRAAFASMAREAVADADRMGAVTSKLKDISSAYKTVQSALQEYAENGYMSMDNVAAMLDLDDAYLAALVNEQGQVTLNADSYRLLAEARLAEAESAAISQAMSDISQISSNGEASAKQYLIDNNFALANSNLQLAETYGQVEIAAKRALAAQGAGQYTRQAVNGVMDALNAKMAIINAGRLSLAKSSSGSLGGSKSSSGGSSSNSKPSSKEIDWFEYRIKELDEAIQLAKTHLDNLTGSKSKNHLINTMESLYSTKQHDLQQGLAMYSKMAQAELAKIPKDFQDAVQNGALGVTDFIGNGNDDLVEAIENYRKLAEKVGDLENEVAELDATIRKLQVDKFKNIADDYEKLIGVTDDYRDKIQSVIDLEENSGNRIGVGFYDSLITQTQERKKLLEEEFDTLNKDMQNALSGGKVKLGSDEWKEMRDIIVDVDSEIIQCSADIEDFVNAKLELKVKEFEEIQDALDGINNSLSDYISLIEKDTVTNGTTELVFTKEALTQMGLLRQQYELASEKVELYNKRMEELRKTYSDGLLSETEYREQLMELISAQNEQAVAMKDSKDAILDLIRNGIDEVCDAIDKETEAYQKLIDKKKEALEQDKDEADFQKQVAEKQKAIFAIQRQLAALGDADDLESNARRKQLQSDLLDAKTELDELYADHNYDLQMDMLDKEAEAYEEAQEEKKNTLQDSLNDEEAIIAKYLQEVIDNHTSVYATLQELGLVYGIKLEESITEPWRVGEDALGQYAISLGSQTSLFISQLQGVENEIYGVQANANNMAYSLINAFGVSSAGLINEIGNVAYALSVDYGYAQNLGNMLSSVLNANYNTSGIVSSIYSIRDAANAAAGAIAGMMSGNISTPTQTNPSKMKFTDWVTNNKNQLKIKNNPLPGATGVAGAAKYIRAYAKGGVVTKDDDNPLNPIAESVGEDTMVAVKEGEWIVDRDTVEGLTPLAKALDVIDIPFLTNSVSNDRNNLKNMDLLNPLNHYVDVVPNNTNNDINVVNEVNINGNVDNDNVRRIQKMINDTINKSFKDMLREVRY